MFNPWYRNNDVAVGPLNESNELTLDVPNFIKYANLLKSQKKDESGSMLPRYMLSEFLVGPTRLNYFDEKPYIGMATKQYASQLVIQNLERMVFHPDIGFFFDTTISDESNRRVQRKKVFAAADDGAEDEAMSETVQTEEDDEKKRIRSLHSDFTRHNSPQDALKRVLNSPIFNGNCTKSILQSNKSELYYQLTFPLENCGRMYVLPAPLLPCYSTALPLHFLCKLFDLNPYALPRRLMVPIGETIWAHLAEAYGITHVLMLPSNVSIFNRRDPVIQEGGIENIALIFVYGGRDADVQLNSPLGCYNKHEDYDGDTNTQSVGKGVESHVEINFNMMRQMMPLMRTRFVVPQNMLSRLMLQLVLRPGEGFEDYDEILCEKGRDERAFAVIEHKFRYIFNLTVRGRKDAGKCLKPRPLLRDVDWSIKRVQAWIALEMVRRVRIVMERLMSEESLKARASEVFGESKYASVYEFYLRQQIDKIASKLTETMIRDVERDTRSAEDLCNTTDDDMVEIVDRCRDLLHNARQVWSRSVLSSTSNCQTLIDNVIRSVYTLWGDDAATDLLDHLCRKLHRDTEYLFMGADPYSLPCIVNVLSRAKGDFDALINMQTNVYARLSDDRKQRALEDTRDEPLPLGDRDIVETVSAQKIQHNIAYVDNFVDGSKKIPKYCKQANSKKWALQNVYYYDGNLWLNGEVIVENVGQYFSMELFGDVDMVAAILSDEVSKVAPL
nr:MAG: hypothetical protein [Apis mellifra filamentous-like virus]